MKGFQLLFAAGLLLTSCASGADLAGNPSKAEVLARSTPSVVLIDGIACDSRLQGSGTIVRINGQQRLLTNRHVIEGAQSLRVRGVQLNPTAAVTSPVYDLASIEVEPSWAPIVPELEIAKGEVAVGDSVTLVGYASGRHLSAKQAQVQLFSEGDVYGYRGVVMLIDKATQPGFSGGAVLDQQGRLVGLLMAVDQATGLSLAIPLATLGNETTYTNMKREPTSC